VRLLLDTNVLLWALIEPGKFKPDIRAVLEDPAHEILFSAASVWEISIKAALGRTDFRTDFHVSPARIVTEALACGFAELPVRSEAVVMVAALPHHHRDPFDRLLVAQAMTEPAILYTADTFLANYSELVLCI
jgi:PIN domain nuclease of toxin-antitoxin system